MDVPTRRIRKLVIGVITYLPFLRKTLSPLSKMIAILERADVDNLSERLSDTSGPSEVRRLARSYNEMLSVSEHRSPLAAHSRK